MGKDSRNRIADPRDAAPRIPGVKCGRVVLSESRHRRIGDAIDYSRIEHRAGHNHMTNTVMMLFEPWIDVAERRLLWELEEQLVAVRVNYRVKTRASKARWVRYMGSESPAVVP